jgi:hypothetical protein
LIDIRQHSSILDVQYCGGTVCDTDHSLAIAEIRVRLSVTKQVTQKFDMDRFCLDKPSSMEVKGH